MPRFFSRAREPMSSYTHWLGLLFACLGTVLLVLRALGEPKAEPLIVFAVVVFGCSLMALYTASSYYHFVNPAPQVLLRLRKLDHAMIYVLIAGSYTPLLLRFFPREKGLWFTFAIWGIAVLGILIKICWFSAPRWLSTALYILMGWAILVDIPSLAAMPTGAIWLLAAGGVSYTVGGLVYIFKWPNFLKSFGFHELFHIFVLLGSLLHYCTVYFYVL